VIIWKFDPLEGLGQTSFEEILSFETSKPKFEDLTQNDFIVFREENIFGYDPPEKR